MAVNAMRIIAYRSLLYHFRTTTVLSGRTRGRCRPNRCCSSFTDKEYEEKVRNHKEVKSVLKEIEADFEDVHTHGSANNTSRSDIPIRGEIPQNLQDKYVLYRDQDAEVILDVDEELKQAEDDAFDGGVEVAIKPRRHERRTMEGIALTRGVTGVFDIGELVHVLRMENAFDICVIKVPRELSYANYLVLASGKSPRHLTAIIEFVNKIYKKKKDDDDDFLKIQGKDCTNWIALDMGNIVLHAMDPDTRSRYDIETLWSVGEKYDNHGDPDDGTVSDDLQRHIDYLAEMRPLMNESETSSTGKAC